MRLGANGFQLVLWIGSMGCGRSASPPPAFTASEIANLRDPEAPSPIQPPTTADNDSPVAGRRIRESIVLGYSQGPMRSDARGVTAPAIVAPIQPVPRAMPIGMGRASYGGGAGAAGGGRGGRGGGRGGSGSIGGTGTGAMSGTGAGGTSAGLTGGASAGNGVSGGFTGSGVSGGFSP